MSKIITQADSKIYMETQAARIVKVIISKRKKIVGFTLLDVQCGITAGQWIETRTDP